MPYCPECGQSVAPTAKFCRHCGASQAEPAQPVAKPAPPLPNPPEQEFCRICKSPMAPGEMFCGNCGAKDEDASGEAGQPPAPGPSIPAPSLEPVTSNCPSCGAVMPPDMKFCGSCGASMVLTAPVQAPVYEEPPAATLTPPPPPVAITADAPVQQQAGPRTCRVCGSPITPNAKFCAKCCAMVKDEMAVPAPAPFVAPPPPPTPAPQPVPAAVCQSCGIPISGKEKFCGSCGSPVTVTPPANNPPAPPAGKFCGSCGSPVSATTKFCGICGAAVLAGPALSGIAPAAPAPAAPAAGSSAGAEEVIGVIGNAKKEKMLGISSDTFSLIVTSRRMIVAQLTQSMMNAAIAESQAKAKAEGKGYFGQIKDQFAAMFQYALRYESMPPDQALLETPGNFAIENMQVTSITMKLKSTGIDDDTYEEFRMILQTPGGKYEYVIANDERFVNLLKMVYGERLHMPFGYFSKAGVRIKFF